MNKTSDMKLLRLLPFIILVVFLSYTGYKCLARENVPIPEHYWALALICANALLYWWNFKYGILLTGVILLLAMFGFIVFTPLKSLTNYGMTIAGLEISTPFMAPSMLLIFFTYIGVNFKALMNFYIDRKLRKTTKE
jgi:hypothetical protein